ncbi:MAG: TonB-dependent receptor [Cellulophaga sp.]
MKKNTNSTLGEGLGLSSRILRLMKLTTFLFLITFFQMSAKGYSQKSITIKMHNVSLKEMFEEVERLADVTVFYNDTHLDMEQLVSLNFKNKPIDKILSSVLKNKHIVYEISNKHIILKKISTANFVQREKIEGLVKDNNGQPLVGVTVLIKGTINGTNTDFDGKYSIEAVKGAILVFSYIGMKTKEVIVAEETTLNVSMEEDAANLDEVVIVGYGSQRKKDITGSIVTIKAEELESMPNVNVMDGLQGKAPGLRITYSNSAPNSTPTLRVRGENSLTANNSPLIILDGIEYSGAINDISPGDVASVSVLKDASSTAIYGARASNGVIIITTKRGKTGKARISYRGSTSIQSVESKLNLLKGPGYVKFLQDWNSDIGATDLAPESLLFSSELPHYQSKNELDWQDLVFRQAIQHDHQISLSGGSEDTKYYSSLSFLDQEGILEGSGLKRLSARTNVDFRINDYLQIGSNIQFTYKDFGGVSPNLTNAVKASPYGDLKDDHGKYTFFHQFPETYYSNPFANFGSTSDDISKRTLINLFAKVKLPFIEGLSYNANLGVDSYNREKGTYNPITTLSGLQPKGNAFKGIYTNLDWTFENILKYNKTIGKNVLDVTLLYSRESNKFESTEARGKGFVTDDNLYHNLEAADSKEIFSELTETDLTSQMGRLNYTFDNKYAITLTGRRDGYSGFGKNNKYAFFPSAAIAWTLSNEKFLEDSKIDFLKIRASLGKNGNMAVNPYQTLDRFGIYTYVYGDNETSVNGSYIRGVGNPDLKWETTKSFNLGLDYSLLDSRISGSIEYYKSQTSDLLMSRAVPIINGYSSILFNVGKTENWGLELNLNTKNIKTNDFEWTSSLNISLNRDKIVALRGDGVDDIGNKWFIGESLRVYYDYKMNGVWQTSDDIANSHQPDAKPGHAKIEDFSGDGVISGEDRQIIGSRLPDWTAGLTNTVKYKQFTFSVYVNTVQGITKRNDLLNPGAWLIEKNTNYLDIPYWTPDNPSNTYVAPAYNENALGHYFYQDASYVRIKDVSLSYDFSNKTVSALGVEKLRIFLSGRNLHTFTNFLGYDPESNANFAAYPNARTFMLGVNLNF